MPHYLGRWEFLERSPILQIGAPKADRACRTRSEHARVIDYLGKVPHLCHANNLIAWTKIMRCTGMKTGIGALDVQHR